MSHIENGERARYRARFTDPTGAEHSRTSEEYHFDQLGDIARRILELMDESNRHLDVAGPTESTG